MVKSRTFGPRPLLLLLAGAMIAPAAHAWLNGGAQTAAELNQITTLAADKNFQKQCPITLNETPAVDQLVGRNVLSSETGVDPKMIVEWDENEDFPSIGLPHVVWFPPILPADQRVDESFPPFWTFLKVQYNNPNINHGTLPFPTDIDPNQFPSAWIDQDATKAAQEIIATTSDKATAEKAADDATVA